MEIAGWEARNSVSFYQTTRRTIPEDSHLRMYISCNISFSVLPYLIPFCVCFQVRGMLATIRSILLSSRLLSRMLRLKCTIVLPVVCMGLKFGLSHEGKSID
jgi:hypothetical protein